MADRKDREELEELEEQGQSAADAEESETDDEASDETETEEIDWKAEAEKYKAIARKQEKRAKANAAAAKKLEEIEEQQKSELDKAIDKARKEGKAEALRESAARLVEAEVKAAAAGTKLDIDALLDGLDRSRFVTDELEPDTEAIADWISRIAPKPQNPDLGQGRKGKQTEDDPFLAGLTDE